jgi:hypothetical protein
VARETAKGIHKPKDPAEEGEEPKVADDGQENANLEGYTGKDGSKSLGYLKQPPVADRSGLGVNADDAGRTHQEPGDNSGAGPSDQAREAREK